MRQVKYDRVSRMDRARRRRVRRRVMAVIKWAAVLLGAAAFAVALTVRAAGGIGRRDAATIFILVVVLWGLLEMEARVILDYAREAMRVRTREKVLARRSGHAESK